MEDFLKQKKHSYVRKVQIDRQTVIQFFELIKVFPKYDPIFVENRIYNSTTNDLLKRRCKAINITIITIHDLRHPYVKPTTKNIFCKSRNPKPSNVMAWDSCFSTSELSKAT